MTSINLDSNTANVIRNLLRDSAREYDSDGAPNDAYDPDLAALCGSALDGNADHLAHCIGVVIAAGHGSDNWSLYSETEELSALDRGITATQYDAALLESLTCAEPEGWIEVNGRRVYAQ